MPIKKRHAIRDSDIRDIVENLKSKLGQKIEELLQGKVEIAELDSGEEIILVDERPALLKKNEELFPFTTIAGQLRLKRVTVDMGAIEPISTGADIMAPGIVDFDGEIEKGNIVAVEDEDNRKVVAIGVSLKEGSSLKGEKGKVVKNVHHVGDRFWSLMDEI